ncbi:MAG: exodeoxyribonuclease VII large subunit [Deltaproteobacteria bacterium RBG_16_54_18]|nr:MAG: exodeoxyribonuclease VII large subunit [Deltaproteobacteria bacterium RBG_16_54_18]
MMDTRERRILTVSELTQGIKELLETAFDEVWVQGEVSNVRRPPSGHLYFTLKDAESQIRGVVFKMQSRMLRFNLEDGQHVICWGRVGVYEKRGEYQIIVDYMEPRGIGSLQLAFEQLKQRLFEEGLFDEARKRPLPLVPGRIGIVTSPTGAVIRDMVRILRRRFENIEILLYPVKVQGEGAAVEIAQGIEYLGARGQVDVVIVGRGGGSLEDLWAFNEEVVARAIFNSPIPVVSAVGHETDFTIADFVADVRASTPSAAAEIVVQQKRDLIRVLDGLTARMARVMDQVLLGGRERVQGVQKRIRDPRRRIDELRLRLDEDWGRLAQAIMRTWRENRERQQRVSRLLVTQTPVNRIQSLRMVLDQARKGLDGGMVNLVAAKRGIWEKEVARLDAMSPLAILQRGYSITRRLPDGLILRDAAHAEINKEIAVRLSRGELVCRVEQKR